MWQVSIIQKVDSASRLDISNLLHNAKQSMNILCNSTIHNKLILVLLKPCYFLFPTYLFFKKITVAIIIPGSLAENLDPPFILPSSFFPPTLVHQILSFLPFWYLGIGLFIYLSIPSTLVKVLKIITIISLLAELRGKRAPIINTLAQQV